MTKSSTLVLTPGDPAGIGPDLAVMLSDSTKSSRLVVIADHNMLTDRARLLKYSASFGEYSRNDVNTRGFEILHMDCQFPVAAGKGDPRHSDYIINTLDRAIEGCLSGEFDALVTGPVNKEMMSRSGKKFMGHTEYLAERTGSDCPVMLLMSDQLKVALVTTHIPLSEVPSHISCERIVKVVRVLHRDLQRRFGLISPRIGICGLNPHAGEGGKLGDEEITQIIPAVEMLRGESIDVIGPLAADTVFSHHQLANFDVVLAMYHDQGLPVIKHGAFGEIVNVTLGLPIVRTSVDHGTAYDIAGRGKAKPSSLQCALALAGTLSSNDMT